MDKRLELIEGLIHLIEKHLRCGLPNINGFTSISRKYQIYNIVSIIMILRTIISIYIRDEFISLYILSDFSYNWEFKIQWKLSEMTAKFIISQQIIFYLNYRNKELSKIMEEKVIKRLSFKTLNIYKYMDIFVHIAYNYLGSLFAILVVYNSFHLNIYLSFTISWAINYFIWWEYLVKVHDWKIIAFSLYLV